MAVGEQSEMCPDFAQNLNEYMGEWLDFLDTQVKTKQRLEIANISSRWSQVVLTGIASIGDFAARTSLTNRAGQASRAIAFAALGFPIGGCSTACMVLVVQSKENVDD